MLKEQFEIGLKLQFSLFLANFCDKSSELEIKKV